MAHLEVEEFGSLPLQRLLAVGHGALALQREGGEEVAEVGRRGALAAPELSTAPHHHAAPNHDCDRPGHL